MTDPEPREPSDHAVATLIANSSIEIIPLKGADAALAVVPAGSTVTVTCSAKLGLERTLEFATFAAQAGYRVVPHLAARQVVDAAQLRGFVERLQSAGITDLYVIGGDAAQPAGEFDSAAAMVEALTGFDHGLSSIGVACYPEGHPSIPDETLLAALLRVQPTVDCMVSQLCFHPPAISSWLAKARAGGVRLPLRLGLAGPMQLRKLAELSIKIGVGSSVRYLTKQHGFVGQVLRGSSYRPESLLYDLGPALFDPDYDIIGLHLFTFNQVAATIDWQADIVGGSTSN